jgi:hypothetical protein
MHNCCLDSSIGDKPRLRGYEGSANLDRCFTAQAVMSETYCRSEENWGLVQLFWVSGGVKEQEELTWEKDRLKVVGLGGSLAPQSTSLATLTSSTCSRRADLCWSSLD